MDYRKAGKEIAKKGRFGDSALLHVHPEELRGLASLAPGGKLPTNPDTGLPEAFFFLPFLAGLGSLFGLGGTAAAAAAPAAAALGAGSLGAGLAAGMGAATAIPTLAAPAAAAGELVASMAPAATAATALPTAATELAAAAAPVTQATSGLGSLAASATPAIDPIVTGATQAAAPTVAQLSPELQALQQTAGTSTMAGANSYPFDAMFAQGGAGNPLTSSGLPYVQTPINPTVATTTPQIGDLAAGIGPQPFPTGIGSDAVAAPMQYAQSPIAAPVEAPASSNLSPVIQNNPMQGGVPMDSSYYPPAPAAPKSGIGSLLGKDGMLGGMDPTQMLLMASMMGGGGGGGKKGDDEEAPDISGVHYEGGDPTFPGDDYEPGIDPEWRYFNRGFAQGGLVKKYAQGGLASMAAQPVPPVAGTPPQGMPPQGMPQGMPQGGMAKGLASLAPQESGPEPIPQSPLPKEQIGSKTEGDQQLIEATVMAIKGQVPNAPVIIKKFVDTFGEAALDDLVERVRSTMQPQQGDGMSDSIPASIGGQQPAALSEGEFVVPADVVSGLGNGSTEAGAQQLNGMMGRVRQMRTGGMVQPPAINARGAMPI